MLRANALDSDIVRDPVQGPRLIGPDLDQHVLDVVDIREVDLELLVKKLRRCWEVMDGQKAEHVGHVEAAVEDDPVDILVQNKTRCHEVLRKVGLRHPIDDQLIKINPGPREQLDRILRKRILALIEIKIELPRGYPGWDIPLLVADGYPDLDDLELVDVHPDDLVFQILEMMRKGVEGGVGGAGCLR